MKIESLDRRVFLEYGFLAAVALNSCGSRSVNTQKSQTELIDGVGKPKFPDVQAFYSNTQEFGPEQLKVIYGRLPSGLRGTYLHNGPGRFERGGTIVGHAWDGDGTVLKIQLDGETARGTYRFIRTRWYEKEEAAGRILFSGLMTRPSRENPFASSLLNMKNPVNTTIIPFGDKLLAMNQAGLPWSLDPLTLKTLNEESFGLPPKTSFCAHMRMHPRSKKHYNLGFTAADAVAGRYSVFEVAEGGKVTRRASIKANGLPLIHDFALVGDTIVSIHSPVSLDLVGAFSGFQSLMTATNFNKNKPAILSVVSLSSLTEIVRVEIPTRYYFHFSSGKVEGEGLLSFIATSYPDFSGAIDTPFIEFFTGNTDLFATKGAPELVKITVDLAQKKVSSIEKLGDDVCEFPSVLPMQNGDTPDQFYVSCIKRTQTGAIPLTGGYALFNRDSGKMTDYADDAYFLHEAIPVRDADDTMKAWLLALFFDRKKEKTLFAVLDANAIGDGPVCLIELPKNIPNSLHGSWIPG